MLVYSALLTLGLVLSSPWWLLRMATTQRYREGLRQRLGAVPRRLVPTCSWQTSGLGSCGERGRGAGCFAVGGGAGGGARGGVSRGDFDDHADWTGVGAGAVWCGACVLYAAGFCVCCAGVFARVEACRADSDGERALAAHAARVWACGCSGGGCECADERPVVCAGAADAVDLGRDHAQACAVAGAERTRRAAAGDCGGSRRRRCRLRGT